ncbi:hypothetical protein Moror_5650 [Moniliophthora roreri MCA 2997]|nr:hypothetical protein Moror_5650 [Moniliophthora roreri MCA 2997]
MDVDLGANTALASVLAGASTGVTEGTESHYKSLMKQCEKFLCDNKLINEDEDFFCNMPHEDAPLLICAWILDA